LIGDWNVARWLVAVPYPYGLQYAEDFYGRMEATIKNGAPEYFLLQRKGGGPIGAIGVHPPRQPQSPPGEFVIGYWLGKNYWKQGLMSEALRPVIDIAFARADVDVLTATTDPLNRASQNVLRKAVLRCVGLFPRRDPRGSSRKPDRHALANDAGGVRAAATRNTTGMTASGAQLRIMVACVATPFTWRRKPIPALRRGIDLRQSRGARRFRRAVRAVRPGVRL
jgi:RimJ/RimL family protein N-acetyltransferase